MVVNLFVGLYSYTSCYFAVQTRTSADKNGKGGRVIGSEKPNGIVEGGIGSMAIAVSVR